MACYILPNEIVLREIRHNWSTCIRHNVTYTVLPHTNTPARIYRDAARRCNTP